MAPERGKALIIGISGVSSSGKTTLARLLRDIFPRTFILHEDDFYKTDAEIPQHPTAGVADWDCLGAIDTGALEAALTHIHAHGSTPAGFASKEDRNSVGDGAGVDARLVDDLRWQATRWMYADVPPVALVEGFLLYAEAMAAVRAQFDVRVLLTTDLATVKARREARAGYVTEEGFWEDPPGYVEQVVWPNYVKDHAFLFRDGDVEGEPDDGVLKEMRIQAAPREVQGDMNALLKWAVGVVDEALTALIERR